MQVFTSKYVFIGDEIKQGVYITVEDGKIVDISQMKPDGDIKDFGNSLIMPGTINTHTHSMQSLIRGFGDDFSLFAWLKDTVYKYCDLMDERHAYWAALLTFAEMVKYGTTTVVDFFYLNGPDNKYARAVIKAAQDLGIRLVLARTMMDWDNSALITQETPEVAGKRFIELYEDFKDDRLVKVCPAPHSVYGSSEKMIMEAMKIAQTYDLPLHMHVSDSKTACEMAIEITGKEYVKYLNDIGALNSKFVAVHCTWCSDEELDLLAEADAKISHNPTSNKFLGDPIARVVDMLKRGIVVGLGTDGAASNNKLSIFQEMKMAALDQKSRYRDPQIINAKTVWDMGTKNGAEMTGFPVGEIKEGLEADFLVADLNDLSFTPENKLKSHLVYSMSDAALSHVYIAGREIIGDRRFTTIDVDDLVREANALASVW